jgi:hypothetical protein
MDLCSTRSISSLANKILKGVLFSANYGKYKYRAMSIGLAYAFLVDTMDKMLHRFLDNFVLVFFEDRHPIILLTTKKIMMVI